MLFMFNNKPEKALDSTTSLCGRIVSKHLQKKIKVKNVAMK